jgi:proline racemase
VSQLQRPALVAAVDYHTAGEPFRIVTGGVPSLPGRTVADRREHAAARLDHVRQLLVQEPRGHGGMYGCFVTPPDDDGAELGAVFFHQSGFSTACGHGTIALATWAADAGLVAADTTAFSIDVPSGRVGVRLRRGADGRTSAVRFRNVPAWVHQRDVRLPLPSGSAGPSGTVRADIAFGGAFYASVPASALGLRVTPDRLPQLVEAGRHIQALLNSAGAARHDTDDRLSGIYGVILHSELPAEAGRLVQRNVTVFGDGQIDRSPCGSGTTARLALLAGHGLADGQTLVHESIIGTRFEARITGTVTELGRAAVITDVTGSAAMTGLHQFVLDPHDQLGTGFTLARAGASAGVMSAGGGAPGSEVTPG